MADTYRSIVNRPRDFITLVNRDYMYEIVNDAFCEAVDLPREKILNRSATAVWGEDQFANAIKPRLDECLAGSETHFVDEFRVGSTRKSLHISFYPYHDAEQDGLPTHALVFAHDIAHIAEIEGRRAEYEYRDRTTGLYNRHALQEMLAGEIERAGRASSQVTKALLFISLRNFKKINQTLGHHIGDLLLENTANRIADGIRASDLLFRFDGTNLVVLLTTLTRSTDAAVVAQKLADEIAVPYRHKDRVIAIDCHIGISLYPDDGKHADALIERANSSSIEAEERGLTYLYYDTGTHNQAVARMSTLGDLHTAISSGALELYYQPIICINEAEPRIAGAEALIRWNHPERGLLAPDDFIEIAEGSRLIAAIDKLAMFNAVACLDEWFASYDLFLTLNVSAHEFKDHFLPEIVEHALARHTSIPPDRLKLEITERRSIEDLESSLAQMKQLQEIGVDVWIDDFGSGQSSLSLLKQLPATALKIDRGLVEGIDERENDRRYLAGIVESIRARGKTIVVEGVWNAEQARIVESLGCDYVQGFHFARPMRAEAFARFLSEGIGRLAAGCLRR
ncbi:MAG: EAL domain-containing protein [Spirochaetota bacterium]